MAPRRCDVLPRLDLCLLALAVGCGSKHEPTPQPPQSPIVVAWTVARESAQLRLDYQIENRGSAPVWVLDQIVTTSGDGMVVLPDRVIVRQGPDETTASFVAGFTEQLGHAVEVQPAPVPRALAPGGKLTATKHVPLPLASWHPYDSMIDALPRAPTKAVLEVGWLPTDRARWEDVPAAAGGTLHLPATGFVRTSQQLARGATLAIP